MSKQLEKRNRLKATKVAQIQTFEKKCKPLIEPLKSITERKEEEKSKGIKYEDDNDDAIKTKKEMVFHKKIPTSQTSKQDVNNYVKK